MMQVKNVKEIICRFREKKSSKREKTQSLKAVSVRLLILIGIALAGLVGFLMLGMQENRRLAEEYVRDTAELYVGQINQDIRQINSELVYIMGQKSNIKKLPDQMTPQDAEYYELLSDIREQNKIIKIRYQEVQNFYLYVKEGGILITDEGVIFPDSIKTEFYKELTDFLEQQPSDSRTTNWKLMQTADELYIVSWFFRGNRGIGCVINLETVFNKLQSVMKKYDAIPFFRDKNGEIFLSEQVPDHMRQKINQIEQNDDFYTYQLGGVMEISLYVVPGSGMLEQILNMQIILMVFILILMIPCGVMLYTYYKRIMIPMADFVSSLERMDEEQFLNENGSNNILELEFASGKFRTLLRKIQSLKIAIYEKELQEQKAELEYVQEQLRPHFLLNCLSVIHGMADAKEEKEIVRITEVLSEYMRYVMRDSKNQREIAEELEHIASYVEMQKLRYGERAFSYEAILDEGAEDCLVPPLMLQTLVENAVVHGVSLDKKVDISLYITTETYENKEYLYICISDTGKGFSEETLLALEHDTPIVYNGRRHVGLQNIRRRLKLMYGDQGNVAFSNMGDHYGAVVEIRIPLIRKPDS